MALDIELYRRTLYTSVDRHAQKPRRISVIDIHPEGATRTLVLVHGYGGSATQWLYQLQFFGQIMRVIAPDMRGHGMSDDPENLPYTMKGLVDDLELVLDRLEVQRPFYLLEHYEDVPRNIPHSQQVVIPVSAHLVQLERPDAVNRAIRRFIEPKTREGKSETSTRFSQLSANAARHAEMPWLQYYDREVPESLPHPKQLLHDLLSNTAREFPDRAALIFFGQKIGYRELDRLSNRFAHVLRRLGVKKGDRVAIVLPNIPQFVIAFYGILKAGAVVVLGSPLSNEAEIAYQLQHSGSHVLLTLFSYHTMVERVCATTDIKRVIYSNVREYLPVRQRVKLASLIDESGNAIHVSKTYSGVTSEKSELHTVAASSPQLIEFNDQHDFRTHTTVKTVSPMQERAQLSKPTWKQSDFQQLLDR